MVERSAKPGTPEPGALERYAEAWAQPGSLTAMLNYYRALRERPSHAAPARLAPATLILWAGADQFLERHVAEASLALCEHGQLEFVEGASHWLHLERPGQVNPRIVAWLGQAHRM